LDFRDGDGQCENAKGAVFVLLKNQLGVPMLKAESDAILIALDSKAIEDFKSMGLADGGKSAGEVGGRHQPIAT
jgi:hypothetical protein